MTIVRCPWCCCPTLLHPEVEADVRGYAKAGRAALTVGSCCGHLVLICLVEEVFSMVRPTYESLHSEELTDEQRRRVREMQDEVHEKAGRWG